MTVKIVKVDGSLAVIIPTSVARAAKLVEGGTVDIREIAGGITISKHRRRPRSSMATPVKQMNSRAYARRNAEFSADGPVGREIW